MGETNLLSTAKLHGRSRKEISEIREKKPKRRE